MENEKYLNEERYQKNNNKVKKTGKMLLIIGIVTLLVSFIIIVLGIVGIGNAATKGIGAIDESSFGTVQNTASGMFGKVGLIAIGGFINTIGVGLSIAGVVMLIISHRREITAYTVQQTMPIAQEGIEKIAPSIGKAAGSIAKGFKEGLKSGEKE